MKHKKAKKIIAQLLTATMCLTALPVQLCLFMQKTQSHRNIPTKTSLFRQKIVPVPQNHKQI